MMLIRCAGNTQLQVGVELSANRKMQHVDFRCLSKLAFDKNHIVEVCRLSSLLMAHFGSSTLCLAPGEDYSTLLAMRFSV